MVGGLILKWTVSVCPIYNSTLKPYIYNSTLKPYIYNSTLKPYFDKKNVEDTTVFFLTQKVLISVSFFIVSYKQEMRNSLSHGETANENEHFKET